MIIALPPTAVEQAIELLTAAGEKAWHIGSIATLQEGEQQVIIK